MKDILNNLFEHKSLDKEAAKDILVRLANGEFNHSQVAAFLTVYLMRNITVDELEGFRDAMLELCIPVPIDEYDAIDLCGTGGDGRNTFNISTLASFIVAGTGQPVAKHGNNGVSSACGSSNLLAHFGYRFTNDIDELKRNLDEAGICFLHAPLFHPAMKNVAPVRQQLGVKTFFNMLGPMVNPSFPKKQLVGVFNLELARLYAYLYQKSGKSFVIVHSLDGYDEVSLTGNFKMITQNDERIAGPDMLGLKTWGPDDLFGGNDIETSAAIFINALKGKGTEAQTQVAIANAALAIQCGNNALNLEDAIALAEESLSSGRAYQAFKKLIENEKTQISFN